ncbi:hypothetical protein DFQ27_004270 [Actinomortierella ambigua]|uniref:Uncharacterized protein n=1 Tax=Actinomortierella ambigua TaxID=1343610 RepID=A0A9P6UDG1_9FUNG|nr:hypothetical protein DFQ27_004270 [Actinomortierella ambigua]
MVVVKIPTWTQQKDDTVQERRPSDGPLQVVVDSLDWKTTMLLEFQGTIRMDGASWNEQVLGNLSLVDGSNKAVFVIGNHRLEGKVVKLDRPLLLVRKNQKPTAEDLISPSSQPPPLPPSQQQEQNLSSRTGGQDMSMDLDPEEEALLRRAVDEMDQDNLQNRNINNNKEHLKNAAQTTKAISSAPPNNPPSGTEVDSRKGGDGTHAQPMDFRTIEYETVAVIRQKILFNAMPQAIIKEERRGLTIIKRGV